MVHFCYFEDYILGIETVSCCLLMQRLAKIDMD